MSNEASNENNFPATPPSSARSSAPEPSPIPSLISGTNTASSTDWPTMANPTGWSKSAEHLNVAKEGLVGHCWKALTVTTEYPSIHTIRGIQTDSHQPFSIEHSMDGEVWTAVEGEFTGDNQDVEQPIEPFACRYTRMSWATTGGTNGIHAQFVGVEGGAESGEGGSASPESLPNPCDKGENCGENSAECASSPSLPCIDSAFSGACDALQEKVSAHLARVEASEKEAEDKYRSEYDEDRDDWEERLQEGVRDFEKHYDEQMAKLRETLRIKKEAHEARLAEIEQAFLTDRQAALDEAKQRMQDKLVDFEVDVLGEQV